MKQGQTQEPVGGMKWEDVQILARKHAEQIIEMGWRDSPDKDDIIADFISGYASAQPPTSTEGEKELAELRCWKESAMKVMADMQEIGKELGVKLGESIHDKILPAIINYKKLLTGSPPPDVEALAHSMADKWVFETNGHRWSNNDSTAGDNFDSYENGFKAGYASLPSSSVTGEEGWKEEFIEWLNNNMKLFNGSLPKSSIIADHVERYIVKATHVTGESEAIEKAIIEELQSILSSGVHSEYLPEKINDRIAELKGDKSYT